VFCDIEENAKQLTKLIVLRRQMWWLLLSKKMTKIFT